MDESEGGSEGKREGCGWMGQGLALGLGVWLGVGMEVRAKVWTEVRVGSSDG